MQKTLINGFKDLKNIVPSDNKLILFMIDGKNVLKTVKKKE